MVRTTASLQKTPTVLRLSAADEPDENAKWHAEVLRFLNTLQKSDQLEGWNQIAFLFRSVRNERVVDVDLARFSENKGIPVYSPRSNMFFEREEVRLMIGAQLEYLGNADTAGIALGAKAPIVLTSRADARDTRLASCVIAVLLAHHYRVSAP